MDKNIFKEKLRRYTDGTANETERTIIEAWYKSYQSDENRELDPARSESLKQAIKENINRKTTNRLIQWIVTYRAAASILLVMGAALLGYYYFKAERSPEKYIMVQTGPGQVKEVVLPDSSVMWVNAMSRIRVAGNFDGPLRKVYIDNGEAFFKVKHNKLRPFRVYVAGLQVQVLGTSYNVRAYAGLPMVKIGVVTGKVAVSRNNHTLATLTPGNELLFNRNNQTYEKHGFDIDKSQGWRDGSTYLNQASFAELAVVVGNLFNIQLKAANSAVSQYQFTLRLQRNMQTDEVLKVISLIHNTHFRKEGNEVVLF